MPEGFGCAVLSGTIQEIYAGVVDGNAALVQQKVMEALHANLEPAIILSEGLIAAMGEVGRRFEQGEYYVPEMLIAARQCRMA